MRGRAPERSARGYDGPMRRRGTTTALVAIVAVGLMASTAPAQGADGRGSVSNARYYSNQTPYGDPASTRVVAPPAGYEQIFLETVGRHGARSLTSRDAEKRALAVWKKASNKKALTSSGKRFAGDVARFQKAERSIGYGNLSSVGRSEWSGIGRRTAAGYSTFLTQAAAAGGTVAMVTSPVLRTKQSAAAMRSSLSAAIPTLRYAPRVADRRLLITSGASKRGNAAIAKVKRGSNVRTTSRHILRRLYSRSYVRSLSDPVGKALDIYSLYSTAPGMRGETSVTFSRYVPLKDAKIMAYVRDAENFYRFGPGIKGEASSYKKAKPVLGDFFRRLDARIAGGSTAAVFRLAHGEVTMPFAALIKAPGSQTQAARSKAYSYSRNPWRGFVAGRLAGNIEWAAYRNASKTVVVTMRYNEQPVAFHSSCRPISAGSYFYSRTELSRCLR